MSEEEHYCKRCEHEYYVRPGKEPTPYCDECAHAVVAEQEAELARLRAENAELVGALDEARKAATVKYEHVGPMKPMPYPLE